MMDFSLLFVPGGHGPYILASFGMALLVLIWNIAAPLLRGHALRREIRNEIRARRVAP